MDVFQTSHTILVHDLNELNTANIRAMSLLKLNHPVLQALDAFSAGMKTKEDLLHYTLPRRRWQWAVQRVIRQNIVNGYRIRFGLSALSPQNSGIVIPRHRTLSVLSLETISNESREKRSEHLKKLSFTGNVFKAWDDDIKEQKEKRHNISKNRRKSIPNANVILPLPSINDKVKNKSICNLKSLNISPGTSSIRRRLSMVMTASRPMMSQQFDGVDNISLAKIGRRNSLLDPISASAYIKQKDSDNHLPSLFNVKRI